MMKRIHVTKTVNKKHTFLGNHFEPDCEHKDNCAGKEKGQCGSCKHNKRNKPNHYEPVPIRPWTPYPWTGDPYPIQPSTTTPSRIIQPWTISSQYGQHCLAEQSMKEAKRLGHQGAIFVSCPCPKCNPRC